VIDHYNRNEWGAEEMQKNEMAANQELALFSARFLRYGLRPPVGMTAGAPGIAGAGRSNKRRRQSAEHSSEYESHLLWAEPPLNRSPPAAMLVPMESDY